MIRLHANDVTKLYKLYGILMLTTSKCMHGMNQTEAVDPHSASLNGLNSVDRPNSIGDIAR